MHEICITRVIEILSKKGNSSPMRDDTPIAFVSMHKKHRKNSSTLCMNKSVKPQMR